MTQHLVIFEGVSGAGKTTLLMAVHRERAWEDLHLHRFTATQWVYGTFGGRPVDLAALRQVERGVQALLPTLVVWCRPDPRVALARTQMRGDSDDDVQALDLLFSKYLTFVSSYERILVVDTARPLEECVAQVVKKLEESE